MTTSKIGGQQGPRQDNLESIARKGISPRIAEKVRDWFNIEKSSKVAVHSDAQVADLLVARIDKKKVPAIMEFKVARVAAALLTPVSPAAPVALGEYKAKKALVEELNKTRSSLEENTKTLTVAAGHLDAMARGSEAVAALVNGLRQGVIKPREVPRQRRVHWNDELEIQLVNKD